MRIRSQIDAPIELVVAVIILSLSLGITFFVIKSTTSAQCDAELRDSTRELGEAMRDIILFSSPSKREVTFAFKTCPNYRVTGLRFIRYVDPEYCRSCKGRYGGCWKIEPLYLSGNPGDATRTQFVMQDAVQCMDLSANIGITSAQTQGCTKLNPKLTMTGTGSDNIDPSDPLTRCTNGNCYQTNAVQTLGDENSGDINWRIIIERSESVGPGSIGGQINICAKDASKSN